MSEAIALVATPRPRLGKGGARAARRAGGLPAVIYGDRQDPIAVTLDPVALEKPLRAPGFFSRVFEIDVGGSKERVLARDVQHDPVTGVPLHIDFMRFSATGTVDVVVDVAFLNEATCPGLKKGGVLNVVLHSIDVTCRPDAIPSRLTVDLAGLDIGDVVHLSAVPLPAGVTLASADAEATVASIAAPAGAEPEGEGEAEETAEPEIIRGKAKEQE
jgi:large subunit ribosomal protein L25